MRRCIGMVVLFLVSIVGCGEPTVVGVQLVGGLPAEVSILRTRAFLDDVPAEVLERPAKGRVPRFGLELPPSAKGTLRILLEGLDGESGKLRCMHVSGEASVEISGERYLEIPIRLETPKNGKHCTVLIEKQGEGIVKTADGLLGCGSQCSAEFALGRPLDIFAHAEEGSYFEGWSGEGFSCPMQSRGLENTCQVTPQGPMIIRARFKTNPVVTLSVSGIGSIDGDLVCRDRCTRAVLPGRKIRIEPTTSDTYRFVGFDVQPSQPGLCGDLVRPCEITMGIEAMQIHAKFEAKVCNDSWCVEHPVSGQDLADLYAVSGNGAGGVWALGNNGTVLRRESRLGRWVSEPSGTTEPLRKIWVQSAEKVWATSSKQILVRSRTAGADPIWNPVQNSGLLSGISAIGGIGLDVYVVADQGRVRVQRSSDLMRTWVAKDIDRVVDLYAITWTGKELLVAGAGGTIRRENGAGWTTEDPALAIRDVFVALWGRDNAAWAVGYGPTLNGVFYKRSAGGRWYEETLGTTNRLTGVSGSMAGDLWITGVSATLVHVQGDSQSLVDLGMLTKADLHGVYTVDGQEIWVVGSGGTILHKRR